MPRRPAEPRNSLRLYPTYDIIREAVVIASIGQESHQPLVYDRRCDDLSPRKSAYTLDQARRMRAAAVHDLPDPRTAERTNGRIECKPAAPAGPFRIPVFLIAQFLARNRIARALREGRTVSPWMRHKHNS
jgi:hypothetical protein